MNIGSMEKRVLGEAAELLFIAMVESALYHVASRGCGMDGAQGSSRVSDIRETIDAYRKFSRKSDYPLHVGITEADGLSGATKLGDRHRHNGSTRA